MTLTPAAWASVTMPLAVAASIEARIRICTFSTLIILSAIVFSASVLALAFWTSQSRPFFVHSALIAGVSAFTKRADVVPLSGMMTPIFAPAAALVVEEEEDEELGE